MSLSIVGLMRNCLSEAFRIGVFGLVYSDWCIRIGVLGLGFRGSVTGLCFQIGAEKCEIRKFCSNRYGNVGINSYLCIFKQV